MSLETKKGQLLLLAGLALAAALYLIADRTVFLAGAERADGTVSDIRAEDSDCGRGNHECTKFYLVVGWESGGAGHEKAFLAGKARGYGQAPGDLGHAVGDVIPVLYTPDDPSEAYRADDNDLWTNPLIALGFAALFGLAGLAGHLKLF